MKYSFFAILVILTATFPVRGGEKKEAPSAVEKAAQRLADLLQPGGVAGSSPIRGPLPRRLPVALEYPEAPLPVYRGLPPRLPLAAPGQTQPRNPAEEAPLARYRKGPVLPEAIELGHGPLVRIPSIDVQQPVPLPILAKPSADRASVADPTLEASVAAALAQVAAQRLLPVPFAPLNLPDPFENAQTIRLRYIPEELPTPPPITPRTPK